MEISGKIEMDIIPMRNKILKLQAFQKANPTLTRAELMLQFENFCEVAIAISNSKNLVFMLNLAPLTPITIVLGV